MTQNLIIDGVDHSKFDLEWAKRGEPIAGARIVKKDRLMIK